MRFATVLMGALLIASLAVTVLVLSRRKKRAASGELDLIGSIATVERSLTPEGAVLVRGELWPARSGANVRVERGSRVCVTGASGHLLEVERLAEPADD